MNELETNSPHSIKLTCNSLSITLYVLISVFQLLNCPFSFRIIVSILTSIIAQFYAKNKLTIDQFANSSTRKDPRTSR